MADLKAAAFAVIAALLLVFPAAAQTNKVPSDWGLNPGGAVVAVAGATLANGEATFTGVGQSIVVDAAGAGAVNLGVQGTFTGTLKVQWSDKPTTGFQDGQVTNAAGSSAGTITSAQQYAGGAFARYLKITSTAWTSGTASVTPMLRAQRFGGVGGGGGSGGATETTLQGVLTELATPATSLPPIAPVASDSAVFTHDFKNISTATDTTLASATSGQKSRLHALYCTVDAADTLIFKSASTVISATFRFPAGGGFINWRLSEFPHLPPTAANEALVLTTSTTANVNCTYAYVKGA